VTGSDQDATTAWPITIFDYVRAVTGDKQVYTARDHRNAGVALFGHCEICLALIFSITAYPARSGCCRCWDCIGCDGYATVEEFGAELRTSRAGDA
jgi:hypothetical protein